MPFTCVNTRGQSSVDYIISNCTDIVVEYDAEILNNLTDHSLLKTHLPLPYVPGVSPS